MQADIGRAFDPEILTRFFRLVPGLVTKDEQQKKETRAARTARSPRPFFADST
jgi:hypothetical protein